MKYDGNIENLLSSYKARRNEIKNRLAEFRKNLSMPREELFAELCFCLCTPQSKAINCDAAVRRLARSKALLDGCARRVAKHLKGLVRFHNNKARYIVWARKKFYNVGAGPCACPNGEGGHRGPPLQGHPAQLREWLVKNIKGLGMKEASHFLRNIGLGDDIAIIDRHILKNLRRYGAITEIPDNISGKQYLLLEEKMRDFSKRIGIPLAELDLLFWSEQTGYVFK